MEGDEESRGWFVEPMILYILSRLLHLQLKRHQHCPRSAKVRYEGTPLSLG
jgi:hypothetical protein